jgi:uncharacterized RDD family membrane protein YckC
LTSPTPVESIPEPASLARRVNAATIDFLCVVCIGFGLPHAIPDELPGAAGLRATLVLATPMLLEPILIRFVGRTPGQALLGLLVVPAPGGGPLSLARLSLRYWLKIVLGLPSFLYVYFTRHRQTIHDRLLRTAMLRVPRSAPKPDTRALDLSPPDDPTLPGAWRRFAAFLLWAFAAQLAFAASVAVVELGLVGADREILRPGSLSDLVASAGGLVVTLIAAHLGADGRLPGARRFRSR